MTLEKEIMGAIFSEGKPSVLKKEISTCHGM